MWSQPQLCIQRWLRLVLLSGLLEIGQDLYTWWETPSATISTQYGQTQETRDGEARSVSLTHRQGRGTLTNSDSGCAEKPRETLSPWNVPVSPRTNHSCQGLPQSGRDPKHQPQAPTLPYVLHCSFQVFTRKFCHFHCVFAERLPPGEWLAPSHIACWARAFLHSPPSHCREYPGWWGAAPRVAATLIHTTWIEKHPLTEKWKLTVSRTPPVLICTSFHIQYHFRCRNLTTGLFTFIWKIKLQLCIPALYFEAGFVGGVSVVVLLFSGHSWLTAPDPAAQAKQVISFLQNMLQWWRTVIPSLWVYVWSILETIPHVPEGRWKWFIVWKCCYPTTTTVLLLHY